MTRYACARVHRQTSASNASAYSRRSACGAVSSGRSADGAHLQSGCPPLSLSPWRRLRARAPRRASPRAPPRKSWCALAAMRRRLARSRCVVLRRPHLRFVHADACAVACVKPRRLRSRCRRRWRRLAAARRPPRLPRRRRLALPPRLPRPPARESSARPAGSWRRRTRASSPWRRVRQRGRAALSAPRIGKRLARLL